MPDILIKGEGKNPAQGKFTYVAYLRFTTKNRKRVIDHITPIYALHYSTPGMIDVARIRVHGSEFPVRKRV